MKIRVSFPACQDFQPGDTTTVTIKPGMNGGTHRARRVLAEAKKLGLTIKREGNTLAMTGPPAAADAFTPTLLTHQSEVEELLDRDSAVGDYLVMITKPWRKGETAVELGVSINEIQPPPPHQLPN